MQGQTCKRVLEFFFGLYHHSFLHAGTGPTAVCIEM